VGRILAQCAAWHCSGVFLCTDDATVKARLKSKLESQFLVVSLYPATLSSTSGQAAHFDESLDKYKKAEDVVMEALLMARACHGLLSTYSNVSAAAVYLSPQGYPYSTFWDPVQPQRHSAGLGATWEATCGVEALAPWEADGGDALAVGCAR